MKRLVVLAGCAVFLLGLAGCEQQSGKISSQPEVLYEVWNGEPPDEEAIPDFFGDQSKKSAFPEFLVGVWEAKKNTDYEWDFKFERDGSISKIVHFFAGEVDLREGGAYFEGPEPNTYTVSVMGPCEAEYDTNTRELKVKIILDYYQMKLPQGELGGRSEDYFQGPVSEDGETWKVGWRSYTWLEGATPPDINEITANPIPLVFTKPDLTQIRQKEGQQ